MKQTREKRNMEQSIENRDRQTGSGKDAFLSLILMLFTSSAVTVTSLFLGLGGLYDNGVFFDYFTNPMIFLLNWLPVLLLFLFCYGLFGRLWKSYLLTSVIVVLISIGNYYKIKLRGEPLRFEDFRVIKTAFGVANAYDIKLNNRIWISLLSIPIGTLVTAAISKKKAGKKTRILSVLVSAVVFAGLFFSVYLDDTLYHEKIISKNDTRFALIGDTEYVTKGTVYPLLHTLYRNIEEAPEGYTEQGAEEILSEYPETAISEKERINILVLQLESFSDLSTMGFQDLDPGTYEIWNALEEESYTGNLISNVIGGGTINTERTVLTGSFTEMQYREPAWSYAWYLREQGYRTIVNHPNTGYFYSRIRVNSNLGFEEFWNTENQFAEVETLPDTRRSDFLLFPEILRQYREAVQNGNIIFSFNVTMQGHGGYATDTYNGDRVFWQGEGYAEEIRNTVNNYLDSIYDTQRCLKAFVDTLREEEQPVVLVVYGDHKPYFTTSGNFYGELGINMDCSTYDGLKNYYGTRYLIWANESAKKLCGQSFAGEGPDISPCYLMVQTFDRIGWKGSAFTQLCRSVMQHVSVINPAGYVEDGEFTAALTPENAELLRKMDWAQYYLSHKD